MLRGKHKLKNLTANVLPVQSDLFPDDNTSLYDEKVKLLVARYYFLINVSENKTRTEEVLLKLSKEFFISTGRVADIIVKQEPQIKKLREQSPKPSWFKLNWAHLVW